MTLKLKGEIVYVCPLVQHFMICICIKGGNFEDLWVQNYEKWDWTKDS